MSQTKCHTIKLLHAETDSICRLYQQLDEPIEHIISTCPILAKGQYIKGHDKVCAQVYFNMCKATGVKLDKKTLV
jgi:hypothetical protein